MGEGEGEGEGERGERGGVRELYTMLCDGRHSITCTMPMALLYSLLLLGTDRTNTRY